jgi:hypothetical protein
MLSFLCPAILALAGVAGADDGGGSFLYQPSFCMDYRLRGPAEPYCPQPGDIFFSTTESAFMRAAHRLAGAADPHHSGIVVRRSDGRLAVLEAGPHNTLHVEITDSCPTCGATPATSASGSAGGASR